eukprot:scaffold321226_cov52-Attheya_sp.AAC.1
MESTPLHLASMSSLEGADACVMALLMEGHANPCVVDSQGRPPYFVVSTEKVRQAYRKARDQLGEGVWEWDMGARVGPPLTLDDVALKKQKGGRKETSSTHPSKGTGHPRKDRVGPRGGAREGSTGTSTSTRIGQTHSRWIATQN